MTSSNDETIAPFADPRRPLVIAPSKWKAGRTISVAVFALLLALGALIFDRSLEGRVAAGLILAGLAVALPGVRRLSSRKPLLVIRNDGLEHPSLGLVLWSEITSLTIADRGAGRVLRIGVTDEVSDRRSSTSILLRTLIHIDRMTGTPRINLPETVLPMSCDALRARIELRAGREWPH